jgi:hypothetical protein
MFHKYSPYGCRCSGWGAWHRLDPIIQQEHKRKSTKINKFLIILLFLIAKRPGSGHIGQVNEGYERDHGQPAPPS